VRRTSVFHSRIGTGLLVGRRSRRDRDSDRNRSHIKFRHLIRDAI
jgi:hypothetical protein